MNNLYKLVWYILFISTHHVLYTSKQQPFEGIDDCSVYAHLQQLSLDEKIGQLFMVAAISDETINQEYMTYKSYRMDQPYIEYLITQYHIGGVIYLGKGSLQSTYESTQYFQQRSTIPLLIGLDAEWGLSMRLIDALRFPRNMTLGALHNESPIYAMGAEIARQAHLVGIHIIFAPVVDINNNSLNPVINDRSFGQDIYRVCTRASIFMHGLQDNGIIACAKHFPGHGDTQIDSHLDLPCITHDLDHLEHLEFVPFEKLISEGVQSVMLAHLAVPALDKDKTPTSLSYNTVTTLLKNRFDFKGLVITDALDMKAVSNYYEPGIIELKALLAGNDILLCPSDVPKAHACIKQAIADGHITQETLDNHVYKILLAKKWAFSHTHTEPFSFSLFHTSSAYALKKQLYQDAITVVRDDQKTIPLRSDQVSIACIQWGGLPSNYFINRLQESISCSYQYVMAPYRADDMVTLHSVAQAQTIIIALFGMNKYKQLQFGIDDTILQTINALHTSGKQVVVVLFGSPYSVALFESIPTIIVAYEDDSDAQLAAADTILGTHSASGSLPVTPF